MKKAWIKWVIIVKKVVNIQTSIFLFVIYYLIILPLSLFIKIFGKKSLLGHGYLIKKGSYWGLRKVVKQDIVWARAQ